MMTTGSTLERKPDVETETVASDIEVQPSRQPSGLCGVSRPMVLLVSVLIAIIVGLSVAYATDIDPTSIVVEHCNSSTDFGIVDDGSGRDLLCLGGVRVAGRSTFNAAKAGCFYQFYVGGCYYPYVISYWKQRFGPWVVNCGCNC